MPRTRTVTAVAVLAALILNTTALAQQAAPAQTAPVPDQPKSHKPATPDAAALEEMSREAYEQKNWVKYYGANINLLNQRPYEPEYMLHVIAACSLLDRKNTAYFYMLKMQRQGLAYDLNDNPDSANIKNTEVYEHLNNLMITAGQMTGVVEPVHKLDARYTGPMALTWDESRGRFLVGTQSSGTIIAVSESDDSEVLMQADVENGLWAIKDLHADVKNNRLWVASAAVPRFSAFQAADKGRGALLEFNLKTLDLIHRFELPADGLQHEPGPITVAGTGDVYMLDLPTSRVYRKAAGGDRLEVFIGTPEMDSLQDIAVTPDNARLYISDLYKGVLVVDPVQQSSVMLTVPESMNMGRIQSLVYDQGHLVITQAGFRPERVMRLKLDASGGNILNVASIASAMTGYTHPEDSVVRGDQVYYFARPGNENSNSVDQPRVLLRSPLTDEPVTSQESMQQALEKYRSQ